MQRRHLFTPAVWLVLLSGACDRAWTPPTAPGEEPEVQFSRPAFVDICHELEPAGEWKRMTIAEPAVATHLRAHDDALTGGTTSKSGTQLDHDCLVVPLPELAVQTNRDGNWEIYGINADGSGLTNLTNHAGLDRDPSWSPDGRRIAFASDRDGDRNIYVMDADGSNVDQLTDDSAVEGEPDWSPDGSHIVFSRVAGSSTALWLMTSDGSDETQLTHPSSSQRDAQAVWSPDGTRISFVCQRAQPDICAIDPDGTNFTQLTQTGAEGNKRSWSSDGSKIYFSSGRTGPASAGGFEIWVMNADGSNPVRLTNNSVNDADPAISPNDMLIAFVSAVGDPGNWQLFIMNADGSGPVNISAEPSASFNQPDWRPDAR